MNDKQFQELIKHLNKLDNKLDTLIGIARLSAPKQKPSDEEKKILTLCNMKNTITDMVSQTQKSKHNIEVILSNLRKKGIIKSVRMNRKVVYSRT